MHIPAEIAHLTPAMGFLNFLIPAAISGLGALFGHKKNSAPPPSNGLPQGATLNDLLPFLLPLLQRGSNAALQNYQMQMDRYQQADPLRQSLLRMSNNLLPTYAQPVQPLPVPQIKTRPGVQ